MQQSDDSRQLILQPGRRADLAEGESSILERLKHSERFVKIKDETGWNRIAPTGFDSGHRASLATPAGVGSQTRASE